MKKNLKKLVSALLALTMVFSLASFAAASEEEPTEEAEDVFAGLTEEDLAGLPRIGEETEDCATIVLWNGAEGDITSINIKASGETEWSLNMLPDGEMFPAEEMALLCFEPEEDVLYDIQFVFSNYTGSAVHDVDFADVAQAELHRQWNGLVYLVYTSLSTEETVDTSEAEQTRAEEELAAGTFAYGGDPAPSGGGSTGGGSYDGGGSSDSDTGCIGGTGLLY